MFCLCVGHDRSPAEMSEPIKMLFVRMLIHMGLKNRVLAGVHIDTTW